MPTPFPGMDPYLERRGLWEEVHAGLIVGIQHFLTPLLRPRYRVAIERRTYLALLPPSEQRTGKQDVLVMASWKSAYDLAIDYTQPPDPPLPAAEAEWTKQLVG